LGHKRAKYNGTIKLSQWKNYLLENKQVNRVELDKKIGVAILKGPTYNGPAFMTGVKRQNMTTANDKPTTLRDLLKTLFPLPEWDSLLKETYNSESIPFAYFGICGGGYGETRAELVNAIRLKDTDYYQGLYYDLIEEGLTDQVAENLVGGGTTDIERLAYEMADLMVCQQAHDSEAA
jgi:hypothetical protein